MPKKLVNSKGDASTVEIENEYSTLHWCLEHDLLAVADWFNANKLMLNVGKSESMTFTKPKFKGIRNFKINLCVKELPVATTLKFLGTWLVTKLNWRQHVNQVIIKLKRNMHLLRLSKNLLTAHAKEFYTIHRYIAI